MCVDQASDKSTEPLRVAVAGLGVIGGGVAQRVIDSNPDLTLCAVLVRDTGRARETDLGDALVTNDPDAVLNARPDIVIDALPVADAGRSLIEASLRDGVCIVSANKQAVAGSLRPFHDIAVQTGAGFAYSASVGGGAPMVETVREAVDAGETIVEMTAILNGTVNFVLSAMQSGAAFEAAIADAQRAGFAEPDPTADLSGDDARAKIAILAYEAFGFEIPVANIATTALDSEKAAAIMADGRPYRQISRIVRSANGDASASVDITTVDDPFFQEAVGEDNALRIACASGAIYTCKDKGAGRGPTVNSIFSDLSVLAQRRRANA